MRGEGLGDGFVERRGRHVERVRSLVQIMDNDCAGFEGHEGNFQYSPFVLLYVWHVIFTSAKLSVLEGFVYQNIDG